MPWTKRTDGEWARPAGAACSRTRSPMRSVKVVSSRGRIVAGGSAPASYASRPSRGRWGSRGPAGSGRGVEADGLDHQAGGEHQVAHVDPLVDGVNLAHAAGEVGDLEPALREDVGVGAAPGGARGAAATGGGGGGLHQADDRGVVPDVEPRVLPVDLGLDAGLIAPVAHPDRVPE